MLNPIYAAILGIVEGVSEFLPISSTAHLILTADLLGLTQTNYLKSFEIIIQLGAILAVVGLYFKSFFNWEIIKRLLVAFIPTGIIGLALYKVVKNYLLGSMTIVLASLFLGGLFLVLFEKYFNETKKESGLREISYLHCLLLGTFQAIAIVPGVSRSAATIIGGLFLGIPRKTIVEFSFLLAIPTMLAATGFDLVKNAGSFNSSQFQFLFVGFVTSFIAATLSIRWFLGYIQKHNFTIFGIYRIILAIFFLFWLI